MLLSIFSVSPEFAGSDEPYSTYHSSIISSVIIALISYLFTDKGLLLHQREQSSTSGAEYKLNKKTPGMVIWLLIFTFLNFL